MRPINLSTLTYEELHNQLMYNPWTGLFYRKNKTVNGLLAESIAGSSDVNGYNYNHK